MKRLVFITLVIFLLLLVQQIQAGVSVIMNGSFDNGGAISDISVKAPYRWCDLDLPPSKFCGWVSNVTDGPWPAHGDYYLVLCSYAYATFDINDMGTISQQVYLTDVNEITFNVKLDTTYNDPWDPAKRTAVMLIDDEVVWESNSVGTDVRGDYFDRVYNVEQKYKDANSHKLSLALRANPAGAGYTVVDYRAKWDYVRFNTHCGGYGYLPEDLNNDCTVDTGDVKILARQWLTLGPWWPADANERCDLFEDDEYIVNNRDFSNFALRWRADSDANGWAGDANFPPGLLEADLNDDGIVDLRDFTILSGDWKSPADCTRGDIDCSKMVDYEDVLIMADEWLRISWLYGL